MNAPSRREPVVLVHGSTASSRQWSRLVSRLEPEHDVIALDLIGYGDNRTPFDDAFEFETDVELVASTIANAGARVHLVGHSYGGLLALHAALRDPSRLRSLAVYEPVTFGVLRSSPDGAAGVAEMNALDRDGLFTAPANGGDETWLRMFVDYWNGPGVYDALLPARKSAMLATARKAFLEVRSLVRDRTPHSAYGVIAAPTLLLSGSRSPVTARATSAILARAMPNAKLVTLDGSGHMAPVTEPERVNPLIAAHIAEASARAT